MAANLRVSAAGGDGEGCLEDLARRSVRAESSDPLRGLFVRGLPQPSESALNRARALGAALASRCHRAALEAIASSYCLFDSFQRDYRFRIEQMPEYTSYERSLHGIALLEGLRNYLVADDPRYRTAMNLCMLLPLKQAFWDGWEQKLQVRNLFCAQPTWPSPVGRCPTPSPVRCIGERVAKVASQYDSQQTARQWELFASQLFAPEGLEDDVLWRIFTTEPPAADLRQTGT